MDAKTLQQFEQLLVDDFFSMLNQQAQPEPRQIAAPQVEPPRPYYRGPSRQQIEREWIEAQLSALVEASTARLYAMLIGRLDELEAEQQAERKRLEAEQQRWILEVKQTPRVRPPCTPSRGSCY